MLIMMASAASAACSVLPHTDLPLSLSTEDTAQLPQGLPMSLTAAAAAAVVAADLAHSAACQSSVCTAGCLKHYLFLDTLGPVLLFDSPSLANKSEQQHSSNSMNDQFAPGEKWYTDMQGSATSLPATALDSLHCSMTMIVTTM